MVINKLNMLFLPTQTIKNLIYISGSFSENIPNEIKDEAYNLGKLIGENNFSLIYTGENKGLIKYVLNGARDKKTKIISVLTENLEIETISSLNNNEIIITNDIIEKKIEIYKRASAFVILPGISETLYDFFEILFLKKFYNLNKPLIILNIFNFYEKILDFINHSIICYNEKSFFYVCQNSFEIINFLKKELSKLNH